VRHFLDVSFFTSGDHKLRPSELKISTRITPALENARTDFIMQLDDRTIILYDAVVLTYAKKTDRYLSSLLRMS